MNILLLLATILTLTAQIDWNEVEKTVSQGIRQGYFPGGVLAVVNKTSTIYRKAFGTKQYRRGLYAPPVTTETIFDINRLTQVVGIGSKLMRHYDNERISITNRVGSFWSDFANNDKNFITIQNIMVHNSGLGAEYTDPLPSNPDDFIKNLAKMKLSYKIQTEFRYSEVGYLVLGQMLAKMENATLDSVLLQILLEMGLRDTMFNPKSSQYKCAPGGILDGQIAHGRTFNRYTSLLRGMAGNAGLFSTSADMSKFMQLMLNDGKPPIGARVFSEHVIEVFTKKYSFSKYKNTRALGWDTIPMTNPPCGKKFSAESFGLSDVSGSYVWADRRRGVSIVFLANGNYPRAKPNVDLWQGRLSDSIMTALGF